MVRLAVSSETRWTGRQQKIKTEIPGAKVERVEEGINVTFDENNPDGSKAGVYFATNKSDINTNSSWHLINSSGSLQRTPDTDIFYRRPHR